MVSKSRTSFGFIGLCVALTVSIGTSLQVAKANDCCEFALPQGCASAPAGQLPAAVCVAAGGVYIANNECSLATGNCEAKAGQPQRTCCQDAPAESGAQCTNAVDDDADGLINDGCPAVGPAESDQCQNATDDDGDGKVNDGCPAVGAAESGAQCLNAIDDDGDSKVNDGCPADGPAESDQCQNATDDDGDGKVNDGCPAAGSCVNPALDACTELFIPTVSQWGLAVMVLLVLTAGTVVVMRRRTATT